ncbi:MAG: hypothetical protein V4490_07385 [Pseudomonadota bacterium]
MTSKLAVTAAMALVCASVAAPLGADILLQDSTNALINYIGETAYQEFEARRQALFTQAPSLLTTLNFGEQLQPSMTNVQTVSNNALIGDIMYGLIGLNVPSSTDYVNQYANSIADINAANLYNTTVIQENDEVVRRFVKNIVMGLGQKGGTAGVTLGNIGGSDATEIAGQLQQSLPNFTTQDASTNAATLVAQRMQHALLSIPNYSLLNMYAMRTPIAPGSPDSALSLMERESLWRYSNPTWLQEMAKTPTEGLLREIAHMEAYGLMMDYQSFRQGERLEGLMAALIATISQLKTSLDGLTSSMPSASGAMAAATNTIQ